MAKLLDGMERMLRGEMPPPPAATLIGMRDPSRGAGRRALSQAFALALP